MTIFSKSILIFGASARSVAQSAAAVGIKCEAVDLFGDWDLKNVARTRVVDSLSSFDVDEIIEWSQVAEFCLLAGGMENQFEQLEQITSHMTLLGPTVPAIKESKDVFCIQNLCQKYEIRFPESHSWSFLSTLPDKEKWLAKPFRSAGGHKIRFIDQRANPKDEGAKFYLQRYISGEKLGAVFCTNGSDVKLIGITEQLCGQFPNSDGQPSFGYCGSIGPLNLDLGLVLEIERIGKTLAFELGLAGVFGMDFVVDCQNQVWLIEINPRITASSEVLEKAGVLENIVSAHIAGCFQRIMPPVSKEKQVFGKLIVFNQGSPFVVEDGVFDRWCEASKTSLPWLADIPMPGTEISANAPIVTVFAAGDSRLSICRDLGLAAERIRTGIKKLEV